MEKISFLLLVLIFIPSGVFAAESPKTVLAVYMIGGDLEYDPDLSPLENTQVKEVASTDIQEMVRGWGTGSTDLAVIVAYGGSKKEGWQGMTIATIDDLKKDLDNGVIGDSKDFYQGWKEMNMASENGIKTFLSHIRDNYPDSRIILILWDHGSGYYGFGRDDNYEGTTLSPVDLRNGIDILGKPVDVLGFDACFMADIEYLRFLESNVRYVIASEETEPDHGWDYTNLITLLREQPDIGVYDLGKMIVDMYLENSSHQKGALTLSFVDLSYFPDMTDAFEDFAHALATHATTPGSYPGLSQWAGSLSGLGETRGSDGFEQHLMVDLLTMAKKAEEEIPEISKEATRLEEAISRCIVYSRQDSPRMQITGIGIFSPVMAGHELTADQIRTGTVLDLSSDWIRFLHQFRDQITTDTDSPRLTPHNDEYILKEDGYCLVTDMYYQYLDDGTCLILGQEPSAMTDESRVVKPEWDGTVLFLGDATTSTLLPVYFVETNENGIQLYYAWATLEQGDSKNLVRIDLWYNSEAGEVKWILRPYTIDENGQQQFSRSTARLSQGDRIRVYARAITAKDAYIWRETGQIIWSDSMSLQKKLMPCGRYGIEIVAIDLAGNFGKSGAIPFEIPCSGSE